jgi:hypothetical protein
MNKIYFFEYDHYEAFLIRIRRQNEEMMYETVYLYPEGGEVLRLKIPNEAPNCEPGPLRWQQDTRWGEL